MQLLRPPRAPTPRPSDSRGAVRGGSLSLAAVQHNWAQQWGRQQARGSGREGTFVVAKWEVPAPVPGQGEAGQGPE